MRRGYYDRVVVVARKVGLRWLGYSWVSKRITHVAWWWWAVGDGRVDQGDTVSFALSDVVPY